MIKQKLLNARKEKNLTQEKLAEMVCLTQSQYQRRESGTMPITNDEWARLAKALGKEVEDIKEENAVTIYNNYDNKYENSSVGGLYDSQTNNFYNIPEAIIQNMQDYIEFLKEEIKRLKGSK